MHAWDVVGDIVKIGLGAAIGLIGAKFADARQWNKQRKARRIDTLESIAKDFEAAHQAVLKFAGEVQSRRSILQHPPSFDETETVLRTSINSVESRLQLLGYSTCVERLMNYSSAVNDFVQATNAEGSDTLERLTECRRKLWDNRDSFYATLRSQYEASERA
jgi:hypothetical protein